MNRPIANSEILDMIEFIRDSGLGIIIKSNLKSMLLELFEEMTMTRFTLKEDKTRYTVLKNEGR